MGAWIFILFCMRVLVGVTAENSTLPEFDYNAWWGPEDQRYANDKSIRRFDITFDDDMIKDLKERLYKYRLSAPPLEGVGFQYGFNTDQLGSWIRYWAEEYPFNERVQYLNQFPHYKTKIQGLDIHFIRVKPHTNKKVVPLLLMHGWASSFREFYDAIPLLTAVCDDRHFALEVIVPSLPGFAFSDAAVRPGMGANEIAVIMRNLMHRLGHKKFYIQGGDWGAYVGASLATLFPEEVLGYHTNLGVGVPFTSKALMMMAVGQFLPNLVVEESLADRIYPLTDSLSWLMRESGYFHYQSTKPDTLGVALSDSPVGLLAHILQITSSITRRDNYYTKDGGFTRTFTREQLIDNLMLYWSTNKITTSSRIYAETYNKKSLGMMVQEYPVQAPAWVVQAPDEIIYMSPVMLKTKLPNLLGVPVLNEGGHFLALEKPQIFCEDVLKAIGSFIKWHEDLGEEEWVRR